MVNDYLDYSTTKFLEELYDMYEWQYSITLTARGNQVSYADMKEQMQKFTKKLPYPTSWMLFLCVNREEDVFTHPQPKRPHCHGALITTTSPEQLHELLKFNNHMIKPFTGDTAVTGRTKWRDYILGHAIRDTYDIHFE
jgi:hypothetical protein